MKKVYSKMIRKQVTISSWVGELATYVKLSLPRGCVGDWKCRTYQLHRSIDLFTICCLNIVSSIFGTYDHFETLTNAMCQTLSNKLDFIGTKVKLSSAAFGWLLVVLLVSSIEPLFEHIEILLTFELKNAYSPLATGFRRTCPPSVRDIQSGL